MSDAITTSPLHRRRIRANEMRQNAPEANVRRLWEFEKDPG